MPPHFIRPGCFWYRDFPMSIMPPCLPPLPCKLAAWGRECLPIHARLDAPIEFKARSLDYLSMISCVSWDIKYKPCIKTILCLVNLNWYVFSFPLFVLVIPVCARLPGGGTYTSHLSIFFLVRLSDRASCTKLKPSFFGSFLPFLQFQILFLKWGQDNKNFIEHF